MQGFARPLHLWQRIMLASVAVLVGLNGWLLIRPREVGASIRGLRKIRERVQVRSGRTVAVEILRTDAPAVEGLARAGTNLSPALVFLHGGSWRGGSTDQGDLGEKSTVVRLAQAGIVIIGVDYRLARPHDPSSTWVLDELRDVVRWARRSGASQGIDPERVGAIGFSAGAHLALLLATKPEEADSTGLSSRPNLVIDFYGPTELRTLKRERGLAHDPIDVFLGNAGPEEASPLFWVSKDDPPCLILHGTADRWVMLEQSRRLLDRLRAEGVFARLVEVEGARHGFEAGVEYPRPRDLLPEIFAFLKTVWNPQLSRP